MNKNVEETLNTYKGNNNLMMLQFYTKVFKPKCQLSIIVDDVLNQTVQIEKVFFPKTEYKEVAEYCSRWMKESYEDIMEFNKHKVHFMINNKIFARFNCNMEHFQV